MQTQKPDARPRRCISRLAPKKPRSRDGVGALLASAAVLRSRAAYRRRENEGLCSRCPPAALAPLALEAQLLPCCPASLPHAAYTQPHAHPGASWALRAHTRARKTAIPGTRLGRDRGAAEGAQAAKGGGSWAVECRARFVLTLPSPARRTPHAASKRWQQIGRAAAQPSGRADGPSCSCSHPLTGMRRSTHGQGAAQRHATASRQMTRLRFCRSAPGPRLEAEAASGTAAVFMRTCQAP